MGRVEAAIFASAEPVLREKLARVVGKDCNLDLIIDDIRESCATVPMRSSPSPGGGAFARNWGLETRSGPRSAAPQRTRIVALECALADGELRIFSRSRGGAVAVSGERGFARRDRDAARRRLDRRRAAQPDPARALRLCHPRRRSSPTSGSNSLRDLPDIEKLEDAGLIRGTTMGFPSARR